MKTNNLTKKICTSLGILAFATIIGSGICYSAETNIQGYKIPDVGNPSDTYSGTFSKPIPDTNKEWRVDEFKIGKQICLKVSVNDRTFLYAVGDLETREPYAIADLNGDGIFETKYNKEEVQTINEDPSKLNLPPKWVFE